MISITPFDSDGKLDENAFRQHLRRLAASGIGVYVGGSGSGEGYTLTPLEMERILHIAVDELKGKVPVRAMGVEPRTAKQMIEFLELAKLAGVDAAQIYSLDVGHGAALQPEEISTYFTDVLEGSDIPVVLSTHQSVGYKLSVPLIAGFVDRYPKIVGVNVTHQDLGYVSSVVGALHAKVPVHVGGPMQGLTILALGGQGYLSSDGNIAPHLCVSVINHYRRGDMSATMESFGKLITLFGTLMECGGIRVTKAALNRLGLPGGYPRRPRLPVEDERLERVLKVIQDLEIAAIEKW